MAEAAGFAGVVMTKVGQVAIEPGLLEIDVAIVAR